ncbi:MAG: hypothetical protein Q7S40_28080 [Opitutaceae bacterium]|nr:hypothetical protein [Opitutaceae bacterium]
MAATDSRYVRLTRNATGLGAYSSLWLTDDHMMVVVSTGYSDLYSRVQLRDIKGFFITPGGRRLWWTVFWGVVTGISTLFLLNTLTLRGTPVIFGVFVGLGLGALWWNHLLGPGCHVYVVTGVQTARLPALVRRRKALRVIGRLRPLIEAAQSDLAAQLSAGTATPFAANAAAAIPPAASANAEATARASTDETRDSPPASPGDGNAAPTTAPPPAPPGT